MRPQEGQHSSDGPAATSRARLPGLFESVWRHRVALAFVVLFGAAGGYWLSSRQPRVYEAGSTILFSSDLLGGQRQGLLPAQDAGSFLAGEAARVTSTAVTVAAAQSLGGRLDPEQIAAKVKAVPSQGGPTITITASDVTGPQAARLADAVAAGYIQVTITRTRESSTRAFQRIQTEYRAAQRQLADMRRQGGTSSTAALLEERLKGLADQQSQLAASTVLFDPGVQVIQTAVPPGSPVSPAPKRDALLAALIAALAAGAAAWGVEVRVSQRSDLGRISRLLAVPGCGRVSAPGHAGRGQGARPRQPEQVMQRAREEWQFMVLAVDSALRQTRAKSVLVTSLPGVDQVGYVAANLAGYAAEDGRWVVLVDTNEESHAALALASERPGRGSIGLAELNGDLTNGGERAALLSRVPARRPVHDTAAFFYRRPTFLATMHALRETAGLMVVDAPPVLDSTDACVLADLVDAVLLVVHQYVSDEQLREARDKLDQVGAALVGYVVLPQPPRAFRGARRGQRRRPAAARNGGEVDAGSQISSRSDPAAPAREAEEAGNARHMV